MDVMARVSRGRRLKFQWDDGGRAAAGFRGQADDCVTRSIAIAAFLPYREVYDELNSRTRAMRQNGELSGARTGVTRDVYQPYLGEIGWVWMPRMTIGSGCTTHLRSGEVPAGRIIARLSKHLVAVINGVIHDLSDPSRGGTRCVYGWFSCAELAE
jgi:hypothetical protein